MVYEDLLEEVLQDVRDDVDKREGSIIYDALAPIVFYLAMQRGLIEELKNEAFADTASGVFLDRLCILFNIERKKETKAKREISCKSELEIGQILTINKVPFKILEKVNKYDSYLAECEIYGNVGNMYNGKLEGAENAYLGKIVEAGAEEEDDESLRKRLYLRIQKPATSGNIYHYMNWALEVKGVKKVKVFPLENGAGSVGVMIHSDIQDNTIIDGVKKHIDAKRPIGASVKVYKPKPIKIYVKVGLIIKKDKKLEELTPKIKENIKAYFDDIAFNSKYVSFAKISAIILNVEGVEDFEILTLNGKSENISIGEKEIAILDDVSAWQRG